MHKWKGPKIHLQSPCYSRHTSMSCWYKLPASRGTPSWPYRPASSTSHPDILPLAGPRSCDCQYGGWWSREAGGQLVVAASVSSSTSLLEPGAWQRKPRGKARPLRAGRHRPNHETNPSMGRCLRKGSGAHIVNIYCHGQQAHLSMISKHS